MKRSYKMIKKEANAILIEKKSRFIAYTKPIYSEEEAVKFISKIKKKHYDARHNCYSYIIGENKNIKRSSDDGEPSGTAGIPIQEIIEKEDLTNTVIVVTRYFGGILLGAGGLIRTYAKSASAAIHAAGIVKVNPFYIFNIVTNYSYLGKIQYEAEKHNYHIRSVDYTENVSIEIVIPLDKKSKFQKQIKEWTNGSAKTNLLGEEMLKIGVDI